MSRAGRPLRSQRSRVTTHGDIRDKCGKLGRARKVPRGPRGPTSPHMWVPVVSSRSGPRSDGEERVGPRPSSPSLASLPAWSAASSGDDGDADDGTATASAARMISAFARSDPCARCSSSRAHPARLGVARRRGRAARGGPPPARRAEQRARPDANPDRPNHGAPPRLRPSVSPAVARLTFVGPDGRACVGTGSRSPSGRSGRNDARSSSASHRYPDGHRSPDRHRPASVALKCGPRGRCSIPGDRAPDGESCRPRYRPDPALPLVCAT